MDQLAMKVLLAKTEHQVPLDKMASQAVLVTQAPTLRMVQQALVAASARKVNEAPPVMMDATATMGATVQTELLAWSAKEEPQGTKVHVVVLAQQDQMATMRWTANRGRTAQQEIVDITATQVRGAQLESQVLLVQMAATELTVHKDLVAPVAQLAATALLATRVTEAQPVRMDQMDVQVHEAHRVTKEQRVTVASRAKKASKVQRVLLVSPEHVVLTAATASTAPLVTVVLLAATVSTATTVNQVHKAREVLLAATVSTATTVLLASKDTVDLEVHVARPALTATTDVTAMTESTVAMVSPAAKAHKE